MERFYKKVTNALNSTETNVGSSKKRCLEINMADLPSDPGLRTPILDYDPNVRDEIQRHYYMQGPCQPKDHDFPYSSFGNVQRRFNLVWLDKYPSWIEYSTARNSAYCLYCYLFKSYVGEQAGGESFVGKGFENWKKSERLGKHVGNHNRSHYQAYQRCEALLNEKQHIQNIVIKKSIGDRISYRIRLTTSIDCIRFLLRQGLAFRGHDESDESSNRGTFLELLNFLADHNEEIRAVVLKNALENLRLTSPKIQKDIVNACAVETVNVILRDMGDAVFSILVDESHDLSVKEQW